MGLLSIFNLIPLSLLSLSKIRPSGILILIIFLQRRNFVQDVPDKIPFPPLIVFPKLWILIVVILFFGSFTLCITAGKHFGIVVTPSCSLNVGNSTCSQLRNLPTNEHRNLSKDCTDNMVAEICNEGTCLPGLDQFFKEKL